MTRKPRAQPCPLRLYTYTFYHPAHRNTVTLDCAAASPGAAMDSAVRYLDRINADFRRLDIPWRVPVPSHPGSMKREGPA